MFTETSDASQTVRRRAPNENAGTKYRNATTDGSPVSRKRTSHQRNSNTKRYDKGKASTLHFSLKSNL